MKTSSLFLAVSLLCPALAQASDYCYVRERVSQTGANFGYLASCTDGTVVDSEGDPQRAFGYSTQSERLKRQRYDRIVSQLKAVGYDLLDVRPLVKPAHQTFYMSRRTTNTVCVVALASSPGSNDHLQGCTANVTELPARVDVLRRSMFDGIAVNYEDTLQGNGFKASAEVDVTQWGLTGRLRFYEK